MIMQQECQDILNALMPGFPFDGWRICIELKELRDDNPNESNSALTVFSDALRVAIMYIDPRYPKPYEFFTLKQIIAHELGHICLRETMDEEYSATMIGELISKLSEQH